jgi:hypothetical protein
MTKPIARLTTPAQMVAALPLQLGYVPTESIVVVCCHEPRGRMGLTMRFDLPAASLEGVLADEIEQRVRQQESTRVLIVVYTDEGPGLARTSLVSDLRQRFGDLIVTEAALVRAGRFWSYLCQQEKCCPAAGTPVDDARESSSIRLIETEAILRGRTVLPDRAALEASVAAPAFLAAEAAAQRCEYASALLQDAVDEAGLGVAAMASLSAWDVAMDRYASPPAVLADMEAAALAISLFDVWVRDQLAARPERDLPALQALLEEVMRRTPPPFDAPVCALFAWLTYCEGGGALVTIALQRALSTDPDYALAELLRQAILAQVPPKKLRRITRLSQQPQARGTQRRAG